MRTYDAFLTQRIHTHTRATKARCTCIHARLLHPNLNARWPRTRRLTKHTCALCVCVSATLLPRESVSVAATEGVLLCKASAHTSISNGRNTKRNRLRLLVWRQTAAEFVCVLSHARASMKLKDTWTDVRLLICLRERECFKAC